MQEKNLNVEFLKLMASHMKQCLRNRLLSNLSNFRDLA